MAMKHVLLFFTMVLGGMVLSPTLSAQRDPSGAKLTRTERKALRLTQEQTQIQLVNDLISGKDFVLQPNQVSGYNVNPALNFVRVSGDTLIFQTSRPPYKSQPGNLLTDKTVVGRITSCVVKTDPKSGYHQLKLKIMTEVGIGFRIELEISPVGNAAARISANNTGGKLEYHGRIVPWEQSDISIGAESFDLAGFPWYTNPFFDRLTER